MRRLGCLALALVLSACVARAPEPAAYSKAKADPLYAKSLEVKPLNVKPTHEPPRWLPPVLFLLLAEAEPAAVDPSIALRAAELAPPRQAGKVGTMIAADPARFIFIGRYQWLRADIWSALKWCLSKFYWDISTTADQDRRLVLQDACGLTASVPEHPAPTHGNGLRWLDICYPTTGASNWTQAGARAPDVPMVSIWDGDRPARLDCRRLYLWWEMITRVFPSVSVQADARIVSAVRSWATASGVKPAHLEAVLSRVTGDPLATALRYGHIGHAHHEFAGEVAWGEMK